MKMTAHIMQTHDNISASKNYIAMRVIFLSRKFKHNSESESDLQKTLCSQTQSTLQLKHRAYIACTNCDIICSC